MANAPHRPPSPPDASPRKPSPAASTAWLVIGRAKGVMLIATALALAVFAFIIASLLEPTLREQEIEPTGLAAIYFAHPSIVGLLSIPAVAACWPLLKGTRRPLLWMTISSLLLIPPVAFLMNGAIRPVAAIYERALDL